MNILIACEFSGVVREAFRKKGHNAWSCDFWPQTNEEGGHHFEGNVEWWLNNPDWKWDMMIAHPPCTFLTNSAEWAYKERSEINKKLSPGKLYGAERREARVEAIEFVKLLANSGIPKIAIENPIGALSSAWRKPDQYIQPYEYGHDASKRTCLWLDGLPKLEPTKFITPRYIDGKPRWGNQTDSGQNKEPPSKDRWKKRSVTWQGWADAMANQWG